jgi:hypothetical protein
MLALQQRQITADHQARFGEYLALRQRQPVQQMKPDKPMPDAPKEEPSKKPFKATGPFVPGIKPPKSGPLPGPTKRPFKRPGRRVKWEPDVKGKLQRQARTVTQMQRENVDLLERMRQGGQQLGEAQARIRQGGQELTSRDEEIARLNREGTRLETEARRRVGEVERDLTEARRVPKAAPAAAPRAAPAAAPRAAPAAAAGPIITVTTPGGGGASSSSAGGAAAGPAAAAPDLSKVVEAVQKIAESVTAAKKKGPAGKAGKGITQARRRYTDKRKTTLAALRALKSKRIREFKAKTKKMPKAERDKQRREFKKKVNAQYKEVTTKFPTARGMKSAGEVRELIKKLEGIRTGR